MKELQTFVRRMTKLGYKLNLIFNYPWIYLISVNGIVIKEKQESDHGWTICMSTIKENKFKFVSLSKTIKLIRKYGKEQQIT